MEKQHGHLGFVLVKQKVMSPISTFRSSQFGVTSPLGDGISIGLHSQQKWVNRALTVFMLLLKQSYLDGLRFLNLAKYSPIATFRIQMKSHLTAGSRKYMAIYFRNGYNN